MLNWAKTSYAQLLTNAVVKWGGVVASTQIRSFKGSNESSTALALKAHLATWVRRTNGDGILEFEYSEDEDDEAVDETSDVPIRPQRRIDLHVEGMGDFEVESMRCSGPMESFYHKKTFSRVRSGTPFRLIVPNEAILWAGPYLSDLAHHLREKNGYVMVPSTDGSFLEIASKPLTPVPIEPLLPEETREPGDS